MFKKKVRIVAPESRIEGTEIHVLAQQDYFNEMIEEVKWAINERNEAIEELKREVIALEAKLDLKKKWIEKATDQNRADEGFIKELNRFLGHPPQQ